MMRKSIDSGHLPTRGPTFWDWAEGLDGLRTALNIAVGALVLLLEGGPPGLDGAIGAHDFMLK